MILMHEYANNVEGTAVAGLGPLAWNRGDSEVRVPIANRKDEHRVVEVDHDERKRVVARTAEVERIPDHRAFEPPSGTDAHWMKISILVPLMSMMLVEVFF